MLAKEIFLCRRVSTHAAEHRDAAVEIRKRFPVFRCKILYQAVSAQTGTARGTDTGFLGNFTRNFLNHGCIDHMSIFE